MEENHTKKCCKAVIKGNIKGLQAFLSMDEVASEKALIITKAKIEVLEKVLRDIDKQIK